MKKHLFALFLALRRAKKSAATNYVWPNRTGFLESSLNSLPRCCLVLLLSLTLILAYSLTVASLPASRPNLPAVSHAAQTGSVSAERSTVTTYPVLLLADGRAKVTITVTLLDANGQPVPGKWVEVRSSRGAVDSISQPAEPTDADGEAIAQLRSIKPGTVILSAVDVTDGVTLAQIAAVQVLAKPPRPPGPPQPDLTALQMMAELRTIDFYPDATSPTTYIVDVQSQPWTGTRRFYLPPLIENLAITADGTPLAYTPVTGLDDPSTVVEVVVPADTASLKIEYDRLDGAIAFEGKWYLSNDWVWGPATLTAHLPEGVVIERYENADIAVIIDPSTIRFDVPSGRAIFMNGVYTTPSVPEMYYSVATEHFDIWLPEVYAPYENRIAALLDEAYKRYANYMGYDLNLWAKRFRFGFYFPPGGWYWWGTTIKLWGGLCVAGGPCAVYREVVPTAFLAPTTSYWNIVHGYLWHELGHGWQYIINRGYLPWWINEVEGYANFLNRNASLDLGYCPYGSSSYDADYASYQDYYLTTGTPDAAANVVILESLIQRYGWQALRDIHTAIRNGSLDLQGLSDSERDDQMITWLSLWAGDNLVPFCDTNLIYASDAVRNQLGSLPDAQVTVVSEVLCPLGILDTDPPRLAFVHLPSGPSPGPKTLVVRNKGDGLITWTVTISPTVSWLQAQPSVGLASHIVTGPVMVAADSGIVPDGRYTAELVISGQVGTQYSPQMVPVALGVHMSPLLGDFDCNCVVDVEDIMLVASRWRCRLGDSCYEELYDLDEDDDIDIVDIMLVVVHWGETCEAPPPPTPTPTPIPSPNLLANPGFEEGAYSPTADPPGWSRDAWQGTATFVWDNSIAHSGTKSTKIAAMTPNDARWLQTVAVTPHTDYLLSGWIRTEAVSDGVGANLCLYGTWDHSPDLMGTHDWTYVAFAFNSGSSTELTIAARLGYWSATVTGAAWFDDLSLAPLPPLE